MMPSSLELPILDSSNCGSRRKPVEGWGGVCGRESGQEGRRTCWEVSGAPGPGQEGLTVLGTWWEVESLHHSQTPKKKGGQFHDRSSPEKGADSSAEPHRRGLLL